MTGNELRTPSSQRITRDSAHHRRTILEFKNVTKIFQEVIANDHITFDLREGEIHGLLGENGAGKTTLMNIVYGLYQMDDGEICIDGKKVSINAPREAIKLGIGMIHQFFTLVPGQTVLDNIILGNEPTRGVFLDREGAKREILKIQKKFKLKVDLDAKPEQLTTGEKNKVEILKALYLGTRILIMDEPTSALPPQEKTEFLKNLWNMTREGLLSIIFITHKLPEALAISDRITVLRKGKLVATLEAQDFDERDLAQKMVGRNVLFANKKNRVVKGKRLLEVIGLEVHDETGMPALKGVSFHIRGGEILGFAGVSGNGQEALVDTIMGLRKASAGRVIMVGKEIRRPSPRKIRELGMGYISDDKRNRGIMLNLPIYENLILGSHSKQTSAFRWILPLKNRWFMDSERIKDQAKNLVEEFNIDTPSVEKAAGQLSGGNMQKLILAREFSRNPVIIIADKPMIGLDLGSQEFIRTRLMKERGKDKAIMLISEDLDEIFMMSDRIAVMYEGEIIDIVSVENTSKEEIGSMIAGIKNV